MSDAHSNPVDEKVTMPWWATKAPARPAARTIIIATIASTLALATLAALTMLTGQTWLIPPMAASMALIMGAPQLPLSQPRNVIGGQGLSALVGVLVGLAGDSLWLGALAGGLALGAMMLCRMPHSPAAATAVIGVTVAAGWLYVFLAIASACVLVLIGFIGNRTSASRYPIYIW